jgi:hypothetical protein
MSKYRSLHFAYLTSGHKDREQYPFQVRDSEAALYVSRPLTERGYPFGGSIFNYPSPGPDLIPVDEGSFRETDLILLTTRPPMDDLDVSDRRFIPRSFTTLEDKLFQGPLRERFRRCARSEVLLTDATADVSEEIAKRQSIVFRQNGGATYQSYGSPVTREFRRFKREPLTAAFLVYAEHAWPGGPGLLAAFGMGGMETLVWCYRLAKDFRHLLCTTPFVMAEMRTGALPERPVSMDFADSWEITILGVAAPMPARGPKQAA